VTVLLINRTGFVVNEGLLMKTLKRILNSHRVPKPI